LIVTAHGAAAQEYCVRCAQPDATYRCVITDPRPLPGGSLQLACITALATEGRHASCAVQRDVTVFQCDAPVRRIVLGPAAGTDGAPPPVPQVVTALPSAAPTPPNEPPRTLLEAAQRAKEATDRQFGATNEKMREAGAATSEFLRKSWRCVGSLFMKCGE
jgi:hypothetical protein